MSATTKANPSGAILTNHIGRQNPNKQWYTCAHCQKLYSKAPAYKSKYCSNDCYRNSGNCGGLRENSSRCKRSVYNGYQMDSGAELKFATMLTNYKIEWQKNKTIFFEFFDSEGKKRKYYPDFYLPQYDFWIEVKGKRYVRPDDDARRAAVGENIELMFHNELRLPRCIADSERIELS